MVGLMLYMGFASPQGLGDGEGTFIRSQIVGKTWENLISLMVVFAELQAQFVFQIINISKNILFLILFYPKIRWSALFGALQIQFFVLIGLFG